MSKPKTKEEFENQQTATPTSHAIPHSREAEEAVIGSILINPEVYFDVAVFLRNEDFYIHRNRWIWSAIAQLHSARTPIDLLTVSDELERQGKLAEMGGSAYLTSLINQVPTSLNAESYGRIVQADATRRKLIHAASMIASLGYSGDDIATITAQAVTELEKALSDFMGDRLKHISVPMSRVYDRMVDATEKGIVPGIPTEIGNLDTILKNLKPGAMIIVAGRPGTGKTAFKLSVAKNVALQGKRVAIFTLEMPDEQIYERLASNETGIALDKIQDGRLTEDEWQKVNAATEVFEKSQIFMDDTPAITPAQIEARCRRLMMQYGRLDLVVVDYLQIMDADGKTSNRTEEVSAISRGLKNVCRRLNVPFLVGAQINREAEKENRRPRMSDLRESGSIEADSDVVIFPYIEEEEDELAQKTKKNNPVVPLKLIVAKHRNGPTGDADATFKKQVTKFE
jgi:replicative DNA helicase